MNFSKTKYPRLILILFVLLLFNTLSATAQDTTVQKNKPKLKPFPLTVEQQQNDPDVIIKALNALFNNRANLEELMYKEGNQSSSKISTEWDGIEIQEINSPKGAWSRITIFPRIFVDDPNNQYSIAGIYPNMPYKDFLKIKGNITNTWEDLTNEEFDDDCKIAGFRFVYKNYTLHIRFRNGVLFSITCVVY